MEFGRVAPDEIDLIDFTLPKDCKETTALLEKSTSQKTEIFVGCAKWGRKDWVGKIYPPKTKEADFLTHYARHFKCIELNATFYKMPTKAQTKTWSAKVEDPDFKFCPKFTQSITHLRRLNNVKETTDQFLEGISGFGDKLGPTFLSLHPGTAPKNIDTIKTFIQELPDDLEVFVEFRHEDWYAKKEAFQEMWDFLEAESRGVVITDASGRRDCVHMRLTSPQAFIRFVGNGLHPTDYTRVDDWVKRIKKWSTSGMQKVYFFMHQHEELHSPELCQYVIQQLNKHCRLSIPEPTFISHSS